MYVDVPVVPKKPENLRMYIMLYSSEVASILELGFSQGQTLKL